jgi:hypothetical protein
VLINLTNDAWYGSSSAPYQHLLMYRLRSVESGRPFLRATNTGISAWINAYGHTHHNLALFDRGLSIADVPLVAVDTLYLFLGDIIPILSLILLIFLYIISVVPVHDFISKRQWGKIFLLAGLTLIVAASQFYYSQSKFLTEESAGTKKLFIFIFALLLMVGGLSKSSRSRGILITCSIIVTLISVVLTIFETNQFLWGLALGILIFLMALSMKINPPPKRK